jgi:hypothetical protein
MSYQLLTQTLIESFNALADEVQALTDRKTILEHKLRYAHEQVSFFDTLFYERLSFVPWMCEPLYARHIPCTPLLRDDYH